MLPYTTERVLDVRHWDKRLFSFTTTRPAGLRYHNGQFVMVGLEVDGTKIVRPYNIASASHDEHLEFYSINATDGALSTRFQHIEPDSSLLIGARPTGTMVIRDLQPGTRLIMLAEGTGIAPFASIAKDPRTYERFEQVILLRSGQCEADLAYGEAVVRRLRQDSLLGNAVCRRLLDYSSVTLTTDRHVEGVLRNLGLGPLHADKDRVMICGSVQMLADATKTLESKGFRSSPGVGMAGDFLVQRAYVPSPDVRMPLPRPGVFATAGVH